MVVAIVCAVCVGFLFGQWLTFRSAQRLHQAHERWKLVLDANLKVAMKYVPIAVADELILQLQQAVANEEP